MNKKIIIGVIAVLVIGIFIGISLFVDKGDNKKLSEFEKKLEAIGISYYEEYYYPVIIENKDYKKELEKFSKEGLSITLKNLSRIKGLKKKSEFSDLAKCDNEKSKITIKPKKPFGAKDYSIEVELSC